MKSFNLLAPKMVTISSVDLLWVMLRFHFFRCLQKSFKIKLTAISKIFRILYFYD